MAFVTYEGNGLWDFTGYAIRTVAADGSDGKRLSDTVSGPSWSPDGTRIAFAKPDSEGVALFTMAADGSDVRRVAPIEYWFRYQERYHRRAWGHDPRGWVPAVAWSPTGEYILFVNGSYIKVVTPDGAESKSLPVSFDGGPVPAWSPDGSRIAVAAPASAVDTEEENTFYRYEVVFTMAPDGTDVVPLVRAAPTGELVAVQSERYRADSVTRACRAGLVVKDPANNPGLVRDCEVLASSRDALFGRRIVNWTADTAVRDWEGVIVDGTPPRVTGLTVTLQEVGYFFGENDPYRPGGMIPPALGELTELKRLDLSASRTEGMIPPELGRLGKLEYLDLSHNAWSGLWGELPREFGNLAKLQVLNLADNQFEGPIPPELGALTALKRLDLSANRFRRSIPQALGQLSQLQILRLQSNELMGEIPVELAQLTNLTILDLSENGLKGEIPAELGQLTNLEELNLRGNRLMGCIPPALHRVPDDDLASLGLRTCEPE